MRNCKKKYLALLIIAAISLNPLMVDRAGASIIFRAGAKFAEKMLLREGESMTGRAAARELAVEGSEIAVRRADRAAAGETAKIVTGKAVGRGALELAGRGAVGGKALHGEEAARLAGIGAGRVIGQEPAQSKFGLSRTVAAYVARQVRTGQFEKHMVPHVACGILVEEVFNG